jgi:hypothetical protein
MTFRFHRRRRSAEAAAEALLRPLLHAADSERALSYRVSGCLFLPKCSLALGLGARHRSPGHTLVSRLFF